MSRIQKAIYGLLLAVVLPLFSIQAQADTASVVGYWQTMDDSGKQPNTIVQIVDNQGVVEGKVVKLYNNSDAVCSKCGGDLHNKPVMGLTILWGFKPQADGSWTDGQVLAVRRGVAFDGELKLAGNGQQLSVIVKPGFGGDRVQVWQRVASAKG